MVKKGEKFDLHFLEGIKPICVDLVEIGDGIMNRFASDQVDGGFFLQAFDVFEVVFSWAPEVGVNGGWGEEFLVILLRFIPVMVSKVFDLHKLCDDSLDVNIVHHHGKVFGVVFKAFDVPVLDHCFFLRSDDSALLDLTKILDQGILQVFVEKSCVSEIACFFHPFLTFKVELWLFPG